MRNVQNSVALVVATLAVVVASAYFYRRKKRTQPPKVWKPVGKVTKLHIYPLKSGRRIEVQSAECTLFGIRQNKEEENALQLRDRSFVIFGDNNNEFKTARTFPKMVLIRLTAHDESHVALDAPGMQSLIVKIPNADDNKETTVKLHFNEEVYTLDCGDEAASWVSKYIYEKPTGLRIGFHDASHKNKRSVFRKELFKHHKNITDQSTGLYHDVTSLLLLNQSSVDDLNTRITGNKVITENFRPCITVKGDEAPAYSEDNWDWVKIGDALFRNVKPCTRCVFTTINPESGLRNEDREPLRTLETYRKLKDLKGIEYEGASTVMGVHLEVKMNGVIKLDDTVFIG